MWLRTGILGLLGIACCSSSFPQGSSVPSSSSIIQTAVLAFQGNGGFSQVSLAGHVQSVRGSLEEQGTVLLAAGVDGSYQIRYQFPNDARTEIQTSLSDQNCSWTDANGTSHPVAPHNCLLGAAWFLPELAMFGGLQSTATTLSVPGVTSDDTGSYFDLQQKTTFNSPLSAGLMTHLSTMDLFLSESTFLPACARYATHPDNDSNVDVRVEIDYSDYRQVSGISIPFHIQRLLNGTLVLDITIESASVQ